MSAARKPINVGQDRAAATRRRRNRRARLKETTIRLIWNGRLPAFMLGVGLSVLLAAFVAADGFTVDRVTVRGNSIAFADRVVERSDALGEPIFQLDTAEIADRVVSHPAVASADVRAELPNRVVINIVEREPAVVWQTGDRAALVDQYGWVLAEGSESDLPRIVERGGELPAPGARISPEIVEGAAYLRSSFGENLTLEYDEVDGFIAHLGDERVIVIGDASALPVKVAVLDAMQSTADEWSRLDVRDPNRPVYH